VAGTVGQYAHRTQDVRRYGDGFAPSRFAKRPRSSFRTENGSAHHIGNGGSVIVGEDGRRRSTPVRARLAAAFAAASPRERDRQAGRLIRRRGNQSIVVSNGDD